MRRPDRNSYKKIQLPFKVKKSVLALGGQAKNRICFARGNFAALGFLHPDLGDLQDLFDFEKEAEHFLKKRPAIIACDLHPEYQSTRYARALPVPGSRIITIQHHHAHAASCMAENQLKNRKVIGVVFDGTGFGGDGTLWGAEFLICDYKGYKRAAHLKEVPLLGGEMAIKEPWRVAAAWLYSIYKDGFLNSKIKFTNGIDKKKWGVLKRMYLSGFNAPAASSMGRLFDAAACLILDKYKSGAEAELPVELEKIADAYQPPAIGYKFGITKRNGLYLVDPSSAFKQIISDLKKKQSRGGISLRFHLGAAQMLKEVCQLLRKKSAINKIVLSGGVFQNTLLLRLSLDLLYKEGFEVFSHKSLSTNDSCLCLGQAAIAGFKG